MFMLKFSTYVHGQVSGFLRVLVSSTNKTDGHHITEILLKVALNTITKPNQRSGFSWKLYYIKDTSVTEATRYQVRRKKNSGKRQ
jgi:hypothetical protein